MLNPKIKPNTNKNFILKPVNRLRLEYFLKLSILNDQTYLWELQKLKNLDNIFFGEVSNFHERKKLHEEILHGEIFARVKFFIHFYTFTNLIIFFKLI